jgi:RHS repeat-associated protein
MKSGQFGQRMPCLTRPNAVNTSYGYDGDNLIEEANSNGAVIARYTQSGSIDEPLAMLRGGATSFYQADGLGSVTSLSNAAGSLAQTYTFDSYGKQTTSSGSPTSPFLYTGRESDADTGLYYLRECYFDATTGRFLSEDPLNIRDFLDCRRPGSIIGQGVGRDRGNTSSHRMRNTVSKRRITARPSSTGVQAHLPVP